MTALIRKHSIRLLLVLPLFLAAWLPVLAHNFDNSNGIIKGKVLTADGKPVDGATVKIKSIGRETSTDEDGGFQFQNVPPGTYEMEITYVGHRSYQESIVVKEKGISEINVKLEFSQKELAEVTITAGHNKFYKKETDDVARMPLKNIENPQVYTIVTKEILKEQVVNDYNSIFKNVPGAGVPVVYNQGRSAMLSRGFVTANLIRNSISGFVYTNIDPANLEVLQAVKGPSGTLFNSSQISFGGLFNRVTKKPFETRKGEISYSAGSFNLHRLTFDYNTPLNKSKSLLMRVNGAAHTEQSFQDAGFTRNLMLAPGFVYRHNDKLTILLDIEASTFNATSPIRFAPSNKGKVTNITDLGMDYKSSFTDNSLDYRTRQLNVYGQINYQLSNQWKLQTNITRTYSATKGYVTQLIGLTDSTLRPSIQKEDFPYNGTEIQQNIIGDFHIGKMRNRLVAGIDYYHQRSDRNTPTITLDPVNFRKPGPAYEAINAENVDAREASGVWQIYGTNQYTYSAYVSDVISLTSKLNVMLSLRADRYDDKGTHDKIKDSTTGAFTQNALSPKLGVVYELVKNQLSFFGNYMNGFNNVTGTDFNGNTFKPQQANQWEIGVKMDAFNHRLTSTLSYYNIDVTNLTRTDPDHPNFNIQDGTQVSKGFEAEVIANPISGLNVVAGYAYNDSKMKKANKSVEGLRPETAGPEHLVNWWVGYRFMKGTVKGLGAGFGGNYGSSSFNRNTTTFSFSIPSYTVLDATVYYDRPRFRIGVKVDNLTNEKYWSYRLAPQLPTRVTGNVTFRF